MIRGSADCRPWRSKAAASSPSAIWARPCGSIRRPLHRPGHRFSDLQDGPGDLGKKSSRDAESLVRDPDGRGWWVGYEQHHSLWLYDDGFGRALARVDLPGLAGLTIAARKGCSSGIGRYWSLPKMAGTRFRSGSAGTRILKLQAGADVADAARAPDGSYWVLLRKKSLVGIEQSIAIARKTAWRLSGRRPMPLPKAPFDNYEGMAITSLPDGRWRFWLVTDDGHRFNGPDAADRARLRSGGPRHGKSPAEGAGLSKKPSVETP